ncbi:uncharacterized protein [Excalfactoria chinensis]|uniref:uncharacterized protein n=1 Tax=Excalfactoria chinensis TaxID=46218 RepID=UPI003B3BAC2F
MAPSPPPPSPSTADTEQDPGDSPQGHLAVQGAHRCSHLLSPLQCACCVAGQMLTRTSVGAWFIRGGFPSISCAWSLPAPLMKQHGAGREVRASLLLPSDVPSNRQPRREPEWEANDAYASLLERHSRCDASECLYPGGREQAERRGPWQLLLCCSCAAEGTHRRCSHLSNRTDTWECNSCAGLGTASSADNESVSPSTATQRALEPSNSSVEPENIRSMPSSQAALGTSQTSQLPEHSSLPETEQETSSPHPSEDQATSQQRRGRRGRRSRAAQRAESGSRRSTRRRASRSSRASPAAAHRRRPTQRGRSGTRSRSPLQSRASHSRSRPRRRHDSRRTPASGERSGTRRSTRSARSRSTRSSRAPGRRGQSRR